MPPSFSTAGTIRIGLVTRWTTRSRNRSLSQAIHTDSLMDYDDDKVKRSGVHMQHDDAGRISVLYAGLETDALRFGSLSERRDVCHPRAATQTK